MKMRTAVVGELQGSSSLAAKAERMLGEITMQLGQKLPAYELELLMSPEYTDESLREWCFKQDSSVFLCSMKEYSGKERIPTGITIETSFRSIIGESICNRADAILGFWNEEPYEHKGATLELLNLACQKKIPCAWISSRDLQTYCVLGSILEPYSSALFKTTAYPLTEIEEEAKITEERDGRLIELCIKQRNRFLGKHKASQTVFEGKEDLFLKEDYVFGETDKKGYPINGKMIFDHHENGVSAQVQNVDKLVKQDPEQKTDMAVDEILLYAENLVAKYPYSVQELKIDTASEISGKKLELILCTLNKNSIPSFSDIDRIYENLEAFSFSTKAITQCEITVNNTEGDGVYYMAGDFLYGNCIAWISPEAQSSFVKEYGPPDGPHD